MNINTILLAVTLWPGQTAHQLAARLGAMPEPGRHQPYVYPVRRALDQLAREGYVRCVDEPGGRGPRGWRRAWYAEPVLVGEG